VTLSAPVHHVLAGKPGGGTVIYLDWAPGDTLEFRCHHDGCRFRRKYATERGAIHAISEHLLRVHRVKAVWS
jgi:hypothetical protein